jgi:hypothetical protein
VTLQDVRRLLKSVRAAVEFCTDFVYIPPLQKDERKYGGEICVICHRRAVKFEESCCWDLGSSGRRVNVT